MKLTAAAVAKLALPQGKAEVFYWDDDVPGFGLRLRSGGSRNFVLQHRIGRRQRRITIGSATALTAAEARAMAVKLYARTRLGEDVAATKASAIEARSDTFGAMVNLYLARQRTSLRPRSFIEVERHLARHAQPLHPLPISEIDRRHVAKLLGALGESSGPTAANLTRAALSACFTWLMKEGLCAANPVVATNKHQVAGSRERVLTDAELALVWKAAGDASQYGSILQTLALTGCRREEIGALKWSELNFATATISLPGERTKNGRPFDIPMSPPLLEILQAQPRREGVDHVFGRAGFRGWAMAKASLDRRVKIEPRWTLHDIRRTFATLLNERLMVEPAIVESLLNHTVGGVRGVYDRSKHLESRRRALTRWADYLLNALVEDRPAKVVALGRGS